MSDEKKPRKKTGGRIPGSKNKSTLIGQDVAATLKNWLGFDSESVARGMIDGKGYGGRLKLEAMWNKGRPIDPQFVTLAKFLFSYAYGTPSKHVIKDAQRPPVTFVGWAPWDPEKPVNKEMNARSAKMIAEGDAKLALEAADRKAAEVIDVAPTKGEPQADEGETLERVIPPPTDDPAAFR